MNRIANPTQDRIREEGPNSDAVVVEKVVDIIGDHAQVALALFIVGGVALAEVVGLELADGQSSQPADDLLGKEGRRNCVVEEGRKPAKGRGLHLSVVLFSVDVTCSDLVLVIECPIFASEINLYQGWHG